MNHNNSKEINLERRRLMLGTASGLVLASIPFHSSTVYASNSNLGLLTNVWKVVRLVPTRIISGLIFDAEKPVLLKVANHAVSELLSGNRSVSYYAGVNNIADNRRNFNTEAYKASVVMLGVADYERYKQDRIKLLLNNEVDEARFNQLISYMRDENIAIKTKDFEVSRSIGLYTEPNDLLAIEYFVPDNHMERHYQNMESITGVSVFRELVS